MIKLRELRKLLIIFPVAAHPISSSLSWASLGPVSGPPSGLPRAFPRAFPRALPRALPLALQQDLLMGSPTRPMGTPSIHKVSAVTNLNVTLFYFLV